MGPNVIYFLVNYRIIFPYLEDDEDMEFNEMMEDGRKMRIMMRGVKIGR